MKEEIVLKFPDTESLVSFTTAVDLIICRIDQATSILYAALGEAELELALHGYHADVLIL